MLDIIEVAMEKGRDEGEETGFKKGRVEGRDEGELIGIQKMLMALLMEKFSLIPRHIATRVKAVQDSDVLQSLFRVVLKCEDIREFEEALNRV